MNSFSGHIAQIESSGNISIVSVAIDEKLTLKSVIIDTQETAPYLVEGAAVKTLFKETEVIISLEQDLAISLQNRIAGTVSEIEKGALLSRIVIDTDNGSLVSIISTQAAKNLKLTKGLHITAMIKLNEIILAP
ncbi:TOBE domain-containing protein [Arcticibacterium luteifluviistationis]|uniref:Tobe domain protein n=1 Tax=Arcticibacterium luteifluviistationis TaxID=1784714 RepID=A0A2Z4G7Y4_9BACT|nr:TOBE domain-containing protein [Arcticibacterium luteifluviistationis]AWV97210.1 tobe domain protein [Arcticibacterium luteifluviistationis]